MGIPTLIKTLTAADDSSLAFADGTASVVFDSTYDEYMFVFTDIGPASDDVEFGFQVNVAGGSGYNETVTSAYFRGYHEEDGTASGMGIISAHDQAQGTAEQTLAFDIGNAADESAAGVLHIFSPSNTTFVTHFWSRMSSNSGGGDYAMDSFVNGYFNLTGAVDEISFEMSSGNFDGVIQMYGIA